MDFVINYLSFYVIQVEGQGEQARKTYKHFQTLDQEEYELSNVKDFLDGELEKITKRKVDIHPKSEQVPTKIGRFIVEPGYGLDSNPNFNLFSRARQADSKEAFQKTSEAFLAIYLDTNAVRGGAFLIASAKLRKYFDEPFIFIMKCDFEPKVATITDEATLLRKVEMAITTKGMKSIQYPYMPEEGMIEESQLKIHQASHAHYFEEFLKYVEYGESMPQIMKSQVKTMVEEHFHEVLEEDSTEFLEFEKEMEIWEASPKREIQERLTTEQVMEATAQIVENAPEADLEMKLDHISLRALLSDFGEAVHIAKIGGRYVTVIESDSILFEKEFSPIEFLQPDELEKVLERVGKKVLK
ncbi:DUF3900 domain-containing protein [Heyndrickxia acidiproducens]|uniref:DUF3900 domain-containing protein n=1 Tax=Heyndrickxia acidiproducens TaxID=1121084 RepID=UPI0003758B3E|nr:DUF3900 domain-containing protein [Heyndrickxia acidiproducens]